MKIRGGAFPVLTEGENVRKQAVAVLRKSIKFVWDMVGLFNVKSE